MKRERTVVLIDAGYFSKLTKHFGNKKHLRVDIVSFAKYLSIKQGLWCEKIYYYTAPPYQSGNPTPDEQERKRKYDRFADKLKQANIVLREGRLQKINQEFTQKGVDTLLTMDLIQLAASKKYSTIILLACDTDFVPVIKEAKEIHGVETHLYYYSDRIRNSPFSLSNHLIESCPSKTLLTKEFFTHNLRDNVY